MIEVTQSNSPVVLGLPHTGTDLAGYEGRFHDRGLARVDTDWHIHDLYAGLADVTTVRTPVHRYVIDVNRDPSGQSLYPGQNTTTLCPLTDFDGAAIYADGAEPDTGEIEARRQQFHAPYHAALQAELERVRGLHGFAVLYDCHSIRSQIPFLFDGILPDFNIGTNMGATCAAQVEQAVTDICAQASGYTHIVNGRFKGGWTTRHYGRPQAGLHAIQMELAQATYMVEAPPWSMLPTRADALRTHLQTILETLIQWRPHD